MGSGHYTAYARDTQNNPSQFLDLNDSATVTVANGTCKGDDSGTSNCRSASSEEACIAMPESDNCHWENWWEKPGNMMGAYNFYYTRMRGNSNGQRASNGQGNTEL